MSTATVTTNNRLVVVARRALGIELEVRAGAFPHATTPAARLSDALALEVAVSLIQTIAGPEPEAQGELLAALARGLGFSAQTEALPPTVDGEVESEGPAWNPTGPTLRPRD